MTNKVRKFASTVFATVSEQLKEITANIGGSAISTLITDVIKNIISVGTIDRTWMAAEVQCAIALFVLLLAQKTIESLNNPLRRRTPAITADRNNSGNNNRIMEVNDCLPVQRCAVKQLRKFDKHLLLAVGSGSPLWFMQIRSPSYTYNNYSSNTHKV